MPTSVVNLPGGWSYTFVALPSSSDITITITPPTGNTVTYNYFFATEEQKLNPTLLPINMVPSQGVGETTVHKTIGSDDKYYLTFTSVEPLKNVNIHIQSKSTGFKYEYIIVALILIVGIWFLIKKFSKK